MLRGARDYRLERWQADGVPLATVRSCAAEGPMPAVVIYHDFNGKKTDDLLRMAVPLADAGCLAVLPDAALHGERAPEDFRHRLENDHDGLFLDALDGTVKESSSVLEWIAAQDGVDPERIGVVGTSMGGAIVLALACQPQAHRLGAAVALIPAVPGPGRAGRPEAAYAPDASACFPTPLLIIRGTGDHPFHPNARSFYDELIPHYAAAPERLRFVDVPGGPHRIGAYWVEETLAWLGKFL